MEIPILNDLLIVLGLAIGVLFVCYHLKVPAVIGFIVTGVLAGPQTLGLVKVVHEVEILAEIGVVLLLFTIGVEFSYANLLTVRKTVLLGGPLQVVGTGVVGLAMGHLAGRPLGEAVFIGFLLSLSSTAIVLKLLQERAEVDSPQGRTSLGILIFQDLAIVPMMLCIPLLAGQTENVGASLLGMGIKASLIILLVVASAKWIVPQVMYQIARTRSRELFLLGVVVGCFAVAWLTATAGLSLALGAFLAGLIISETEYSHQALGNVLPFRDIFASFFFISIGMLLDVNYLLAQPGVVALVTLGALAVKALLATGTVLLLGLPLRTAILAGLALSQVGEFSFILAKAGVSQGLLAAETYQLFLDATVLTMALTPVIMAVAPRLAELSWRLPLPLRIKTGSLLVEAQAEVKQSDHLIIIGFGVNGRNLARAAKASGIPYVIIEMNPDTVKTERLQGEPIYYGDATQEEILHHAHIGEARIVVVAINDPAATRRITAVARQLHPKVALIVRTRYLQEVQALYELGADHVIPEEFETSVEIFTLVLKKFLISREEIERFIQEVRANCYVIFRGGSEDMAPFRDLPHQLQDIEISTIRLLDQAPLVGKSLAEMELRKKFGVTVLAVRRGSRTQTNPAPDMRLEGGDLLVVMGTPAALSGATELFTASALN